MTKQSSYRRHRGFPWGISHLFLLINVLVGYQSQNPRKADFERPFSLQTMLVGSGAVISRRYTEFAVPGLFAVVVIQGFGYGLIFDLNFFLRNLSVVGGLIMVFSDAITSKSRNFAGLPSLTENDRRK